MRRHRGSGGEFALPAGAPNAFQGGRQACRLAFGGAQRPWYQAVSHRDLGKTALTNAARDASPKPILVEVGAGELIDKITILHIKRERIGDPAKLASVARELAALEPSRSVLLGEFPAVAALEAELKRVNEALWQIEDSIRECEARQDFGPKFVALARAVYQNNDKRAEIKKTINILSNASIVEEKSYFVI